MPPAPGQHDHPHPPFVSPDGVTAQSRERLSCSFGPGMGSGETAVGVGRGSTVSLLGTEMVLRST
jgi:hypothetical protein